MKELFRVLSYAGGNKHLMTQAAAFLTFSVLFSVAPYFITSEALSRFLGGAALSFPWLREWRPGYSSACGSGTG
jgi:hypothetical protein